MPCAGTFVSGKLQSLLFRYGEIKAAMLAEALASTSGSGLAQPHGLKFKIFTSLCYAKELFRRHRLLPAPG